MKPVFLFLISVVLGCSNSSERKTPPEDTSTKVYPTDSNVPADTDDYNKNIPDSVPLDPRLPRVHADNKIDEDGLPGFFWLRLGKFFRAFVASFWFSDKKRLLTKILGQVVLKKRILQG